METLLLLFITALTILAILIVYKKLSEPRELYLCKDIICKYEQEYCCMSCGQRNKCEVVCEYEGSCDWRVKCE